MKINLRLIVVAASILIVSAFWTQRIYGQQDDNVYANNDYGNNDYNNENNPNQQGEPLIDPGADNVTFNDFYSDLSPYGRWIDYPNYGRVWIFNAPGFRPYYSNGHWAYTRFGWTWVSDYRWGWAPFHYGRWAYDNSFGWFWVPGYQWGPAWVNWRRGGDFYGWAPLSPGIGININIGIPAERWVFVPRRYISYPNFNRYSVNRSRNTYIIRNTTIINNTSVYNNRRYVAGPDRVEVERYSGRVIRPVDVRSVTRVNGNNRNNSNRVYSPDRNGSGVNNNNNGLNRNRGNLDRQAILRPNQNGNNLPAYISRRPNRFQPLERNNGSVNIDNRNNYNAATENANALPPRQDRSRNDDNNNQPNNNQNSNYNRDRLRREAMMQQQQNRLQQNGQRTPPSRTFKPQENWNRNMFNNGNQQRNNRQLERQQRSFKSGYSQSNSRQLNSANREQRRVQRPNRRNG